MLVAVFTWTIGFLVMCCFQTSQADENALYTAITGLSTYNNRVRPKIDHTQTINVNLELELYSIVDFDEKNQVITIFGFFIADWTDEHLTWTPASHANIESIVLPPSVPWLPDFGIANSATTFYHDTFRKDFHVRVYYTGKVVWSFGGQIALRCDLNMQFFPFDKQTCKVSMENWAYHGDEVNLKNASHEIHMVAYEANGVWDIDKTESDRSEFYADNDPKPYPVVNFYMYMSRKPNFYILNLVVPCILIILVALAVFWLPAESGEKVSLGITILLAFSVFQIVLADSTPVNSDYTPVLGQLVIGIMALSTVSVMTSILVLYLHHKGCDQTVPRKLRLVFFKGIATALCMRGDVPDDSAPSKVAPGPENKDSEKAKEAQTAWPSDDTDTPPTLADHDLQKIANELFYISNRMKKEDASAQALDEWRALARVLDRLFFWISVVLVIIILGYFLGRRDDDY